jgi:glutamate dehydrogenase
MNDKSNDLKNRELSQAIESESQKFRTHYLWLEKAMPRIFFEEISQENILLIAHTLLGFSLQDYFSTIHLKNSAIVMCLDSADADLRILQNYAFYGIKSYKTYISSSPPPFPHLDAHLRIAAIFFTEAIETSEPVLPDEKEIPAERIRALIKQKNPQLSDPEFDALISSMSAHFVHSLSTEHLTLAIDMFLRAQTRDNCQYEVRYNQNWEEEGSASMDLVLAWRNTPKHHFLYRMARVIYRHHLMIKGVSAAYLNTYGGENVLVMALSLHGAQGTAVWDEVNLVDFLREFLTIKYFASFDAIDTLLVSKGIISGTLGNFLRSMVNFVHQALVHVDVHLYTIEVIEEALCRHPELTSRLCEAFQLKFDPETYNFQEYINQRELFLADLDKLDTGQVENDIRRKTILRQGMNFIHYTLKTNFFRTNLTAHSFRLDPGYLTEIPCDLSKKFPEPPYAVFFFKGMHFIGFHIRFKDLSRGGLRSVYPSHLEQIAHERNNLFTECYQLAFTQHLKNKDIPEGGSKGVLFLNPFERIESEALIFKNELEASAIEVEESEKRVDSFRKAQRIEYLHQAQRSFIESLVTIVNCEPDGTMRARNVIDYLRRPEYIYLGPDENMHDSMIQWIADFSKKYHYRPGSAFISGKPAAGINHKEFGVTSLGVNVYMEALLNYLGIDPAATPFTVKMSGGPDGDVAGNQIYNLYRFYPNTAKLLALIDISGTIYDPLGLDLQTMAELFKQGKPIRYYPPEKLSNGGFLLDLSAKRSPTPLIQQTLCWRKREGKLEEEWLPGSEMNNILRNTLNHVKTDLFIPAGGRPRTLSEANVKEFLDENGTPTARGIVEGANLYLTPKARRILEKLGVLIIKDSSANKTGVICSSFEVLCGLTLGDELFIAHKPQLVSEILARLKESASHEAKLLLRTHQETGQFLTEISLAISEHINQYTYQILDHLDRLPWINDPDDPVTRCYLNYCLPTLRERFLPQLLQELPEHHKKAIVACQLASKAVYTRGMTWKPSIVDILPLLLKGQ